jgi:hypothetical protein
MPQQTWLFEVVFDYGEYKIDNPYIPTQTWAKRQDSFPYITPGSRFVLIAYVSKF